VTYAKADHGLGVAPDRLSGCAHFAQHLCEHVERTRRAMPMHAPAMAGTQTLPNRLLDDKDGDTRQIPSSYDLISDVICRFDPVEAAPAVHRLSLSAGDIKEGSGNEGSLCTSQP
jgi:hypothetical protein